MKICHISDVHVKNLKYQKEQKEVFETLYSNLQKQQPDHIIITGDIFHTKTYVSPEAYDMVANFFKSLANITKTHIIIGNHDTILKNSRIDNITPVVNALNNPNLFYHKYSTIYNLNAQTQLHVLSILDKENWSTIVDPFKINIALYHGSVAGSETDIGWVMEHGEIDLETLQLFDYALLGDIHKANQALDNEGRVRYAGSLCQNNHGETNDKGYLMWDIQSKEDFTVEHVHIPNPKPFVTIQLSKKGRIYGNFSIPPGARLRLAANNNLPLDTLRKAVEIAKKRFNPESVTFINRSINKGSVATLTKDLNLEDLRNINIQEDLIKKYLTDYHVDEAVMTRVLDLNKKFNLVLGNEDEIARNVRWKIHSLEWDNLFNYGIGNKIDFNNLNGIIGIFGKNYSGKSSSIDSLLYTMFNGITKNSGKNYNIINQNKPNCRGKVTLSVDNNFFEIERTSEKYIKRLKGETTNEAKTDVSFICKNNSIGEMVELNGQSRGDTDKKIKTQFGTIEDFLLTSMTSQHGALSFIEEGSTKRKEILAKFLDLEVFDRKFKLAKEEAADIKGALRRIQDVAYEDDILLVEEELKENILNTKLISIKYENSKQQIAKLYSELSFLMKEMKEIPEAIIDIDATQNLIIKLASEIQNLENTNFLINDELREKKELYVKIQDFMQDFDLNAFKKQSTQIEKIKQLLVDSIHNINETTKTINYKQTEASLLQEVPCGEQFPECKFIKNAYLAKEEIPTLLSDLNNWQARYNKNKEELQTLEPEKIENYITKYELLLQKQNKISNETIQLELKLERNIQIIELKQHELEDAEQLLKQSTTYSEEIKNLKLLQERKLNVEKELQITKTTSDVLESETLDCYKLHGSLDQKLEQLKLKKEELKQLHQEYEAYDLLQRCMHPNGIAYDIIKRSLPIINEEISKVLANIVNFEVFFEADDNKLDIFIKHPKYDPRPLNMGSGAEKTIASMAIRMALTNVTNLPVSDLFILDEPATDLDPENMEGFIRMLDLVKTYFKNIILISHLDSLKDCVDMQICIDNDKEGYAHIEH